MCFLIKFKTNINLSKTVIHLEILNQYEKNNELLTKPQLIYQFIALIQHVSFLQLSCSI